MDFHIRHIGSDEYPKGLTEIPDVPKGLYLLGAPLGEDTHYLAVIGSRNHSEYGRRATQMLIHNLKGYPITIVSGLALGIDTIALETALEVGLKTAAILGSGLSEEAIYPRNNVSLAKEILRQGGTLVSEFEPSFKPTRWSFPRRNRLIAGIAHAVLVIEAEHLSGTMITASLALDYNKEVGAVPGPITSSRSLGTNVLLKQGASPITQVEDILTLLGVTYKKNEDICTKEEHLILKYLPTDLATLLKDVALPESVIRETLVALREKGLISERLGKIFDNT